MAVDYGRQHGIGADELLNVPIGVRRRSAIQKLGDYPFFHDSDHDHDSHEEEARPAPSQASSWVVRHGGVCLAALAVIGAIEVVVLGMVLR
jgi:hypothetical protein